MIKFCLTLVTLVKQNLIKVKKNLIKVKQNLIYDAVNNDQFFSCIKMEFRLFQKQLLK